MEPTSQRILLGAAGAGGDQYFITKTTLPVSNVFFEGLAVDSAKNIYSTAYYQNGSTGLPVFCMNSKGSILWSRTITPSNSSTWSYNQAGQNIIVDNNGFVVVGHTHEDGNFNKRMHIIRLNSSDGTFASSGLADKEIKHDTTSYDLACNALINASGGDYYLVGWSEPSYSLSAIRITGSTITDQFLGTSTSAPECRGLIEASNGNLWMLAGRAQSSIRLFEFNSNLQFVSNVGIYPTSFSAFEDYDMCKDSSGNMYVCGGLNDSGTSTQTGVLVKFNSSGTVQWARYLGSLQGSTSNNFYFASVACDSQGNIYVCGYYNSTSQGKSVIAKYNTSGTLQWQRSFSESGTSGNQTALTAIKVDSKGDLVLGGSQIGTTSAYVLRLPSDGSLTGTYGNFTYESTSLAANTVGTGALTPLTIYSSGTASFTATTCTNNASSLTTVKTKL